MKKGILGLPWNLGINKFNNSKQFIINKQLMKRRFE